MENNNIKLNKFRFYNSNCRDIFYKRPLHVPGSLFHLPDDYYQIKLEGFKDIDITLKCEWVPNEHYSTSYLLIDFEQKSKEKYFTTDDVYKYKKYLEEFLYLLLDEYIFIEKVKFYEEIKDEIFKTNIPEQRTINTDNRHLFELYETRNFLQKYFYKYVEFRNKTNDSYVLFTIINENLKLLYKNPSVSEIIGISSYLYVFLTKELFDNEKKCIEEFNKLLISLEENNSKFVTSFTIKSDEEEYRDFIKTTLIKSRHEIHHSIETNYDVAYDYYKIIFVLIKLYFLNKEIGIDVAKEEITFDIYHNIKHHNKDDIIKAYIVSHIFKCILKECNINLIYMKSPSHEVFKDFVDNFNNNIDFYFFFKSEKEHHLKNSNDDDSVIFLRIKMFLEVTQYFEESCNIKINRSIKDLILNNEELKKFILNIKVPLIDEFAGIRDNNKRSIEAVNKEIQNNCEDITKLKKLVQSAFAEESSNVKENI